MKFDWKHIVLSLVIGALGAWFVIDHVSQRSSYKRLNIEKSDSIYSWKQLYNVCRKSHDTTIHGTVTIKDTTEYHPKPIHSEWIVKPFDTVFADLISKDTSHPVIVCRNMYQDSIIRDRFKLVYQLDILNCRLNFLRIKSITYPVDTVRYPQDTCIGKLPNKILVDNNRLYITIGTSYDWSRFNMLKAGITWSIRGWVILSPDIYFDLTGQVSKYPYPGLTIGIRVK